MWTRATRLRQFFGAHRDLPLCEPARGGAALEGFGDCARWSPPLVRPDSSAFLCPRLQGRDRPGFFLFSCCLVERGNLPNCLLDSSTLTTYKLWIHKAFWLLSLIPSGPSFSRSLCCQPSLPSKAVPWCTLYSVFPAPGPPDRLHPTVNQHRGYAPEIVQTHPLHLP